jgi:Glycosyltransferase like family
MSSTSSITFAVAVNSRELFEHNFLSSPCLRRPHKHEVLAQQGFTSAAKAYNDAIDKSHNDLIVFAHQDIFLPEAWLPQVICALDWLRLADPKWGVLGSYGKTVDGRGWGRVYSSGRGVIGESLEHPVPIQTLDEIVLILRRSSGLRFDERMPHYHLYGADICLSAAKQGMTSYAISAFCIHNTQQNLVLPREFYECYRQLKRIWKESLPIQTTCIRVSKSDLPMYVRKAQESYLRYIRRKEVGAFRQESIQSLCDQLEARPICNSSR